MSGIIYTSNKYQCVNHKRTMTFHNKTGEKLKLIEFSKIDYTKGVLINKEVEKVVD